MFARVCRPATMGLAMLAGLAASAAAETVVIENGNKTIVDPAVEPAASYQIQKNTAKGSVLKAFANKVGSSKKPAKPVVIADKPVVTTDLVPQAMAADPQQVTIADTVQQTGFLSKRGGCDECCDTCCDTCCDGGCCPKTPFWSHTSAFWGEALFLTATDADLTHAQQQNGTGGAGTVPYGRIGVVDPHYEPGFRLGLRKCLSACSSLEVRYAFLETNAIDQLLPPVIPAGGGSVGSLVHHPQAAITGSVGPVDAAYGIDFQVADFVYRHLLRGGSCYAVNWSLGARYGHLEQDFMQTGNFGGSLAGQIDTTTGIDFDGGGLLFGLDGERKIGHGGFSIYAKGSIAPMRGSFGADYRMYNQTTSVLLAEAAWKDDRTVTLLDYEAGLAWTGPCGKWRLAAGYIGSHWFNTLTTGAFINAVQNNNYLDASDTLSFDGLTARVERRW